MTYSMERWQQLADFILPVLIGEGMQTQTNEHYWRSVEYGLSSLQFPPGRWRDTYHAVTGLVQESKPVHLTTLRELLVGQVDDSHLAQWVTIYGANNQSTLRGEVFKANVAALCDYADTYMAIQRLQQAVGDLASGKDREHAISSVMSDLAMTGSIQIAGETADATGATLEALLGETPNNAFKFGIQIMDNWAGGFSEGQFISINAAMKQRKTSLLLNIMLSLARAGASVALLMFESNRQMITAQIVSMLAIEYLIGNGLYGKNIVGEADHIPVERVWASDLVRIRSGYRQWDKVRVEAVDYGIAKWKTLGNRFRIYDRTKPGGHLSDVASIRRNLLRDKAIYKTQFAAIDHAQRVSTKSINDYEKFVEVAMSVEEVARTEGITLCLLSQLKAEHADGIGDQHATGARGGTALDEAVDHGFITQYKTKQEGGDRAPSDELTIGFQLSRFGDAGSHQRRTVKIDPGSGLILNGGKGWKS